MSDKKLKVKGNDPDDSLDFDDFEFGYESFEDGDRDPTSKPVRSFAKGVRKGLGDSDNIKGLLRKNLPDEYGSAFDILKELQGEASKTATEFIKGAKPIASDLLNAADKMLPSSAKGLKAKLAKWQKDLEDEGRSSGPSKEQMREDSMSIELGRIFNQQAQVAEVKDKIGKQEKAFDRGINIAQHKDILTALNRLTISASRTEGYTTSINAAFQRKSLENQYRQIFLAQDILEETKTANAKIISNLIAITKNSALPDFRKTQMSEAFMDNARKKFSDTIVSASQGFFKRGLTKFRKDVGDGLGNLATVSSMVSMGADLAAMDQEFDPKTITDRLAEGTGGAIGKFITSKGGKLLFDLMKKNPEVAKFIGQGQNFLGALQTDGAGLANRMLGKGEDKDGMIGFISKYLKEITVGEAKSDRIERWDASKINAAAPFTNKVAHSITDIIPGYLARILQEQTMTRTGKSADLVKFDYRSGKFSTTKAITKAFADELSAETLAGRSDYNFKKVLGPLEDHVKLNTEERSIIGRELMKDAGNTEEAMSFGPGRMTDVDYWAERMPYATAEKLVEGMKQIFGASDDKEYYKFNHDAKAKARGNQWMKNAQSLRHVGSDYHGKAQFAYDHGMEEEATAAGLLNKNGQYNRDIVETRSAYLKNSFAGNNKDVEDPIEAFKNKAFDANGQENSIVQKVIDGIAKLAKDPKIKDSDEEIKDGIKPSENVLGRISKLAVDSWKYKKGSKADDGRKNHIGPMAQQMKKMFGEMVAPGGKTIDVVNSNGIALKGIQELNSKVNKKFKEMKGSLGFGEEEAGAFVGPVRPVSSIEALRNIDFNTAALLSKQDALLNINVASLKNLTAGLGGVLGKIDLSGAGDAVSKGYNDAANFIKDGKATSLLGRLGDGLSEIFGVGFDVAKKAGTSIAGKTMGHLRTLGRIGKGAANMIGGFAKRRAVKVYETFDVFVEGKTEPVMVSQRIANGEYLDFDTQTPVFTHADIRNIKTGVVENTSNGEQHFVLLNSDLPKTIFVNKYKGAITKAFESAGSFIKNFSKNIVTPTIQNAMDMAKTFKGLADQFVDKPIDIFVKGKPGEPVLLAKKMINGDYTDFADGDLITNPSKIKGAVFDKVKNMIVLTTDEFREGLVDIKGQPIHNPYIRMAKNVIGAGIGATIAVGGALLKKLSTAKGMLGNMANKGVKMMESLWERMGLPKFTIGGIFGKESVDILKDIRSILQYQNGLGDKPGSIKEAVAGKAKTAIGGIFNKFTQAAGSKFGIKGYGATTTNGLGFGVPTVNANAAKQREAANEPKAYSGKNVFDRLGGLGSTLATVAHDIYKDKFDPKGKAANDANVEAPTAKERVSAKFADLNQKWGSKLVQQAPVMKGPAGLGADGKPVNASGFRVGSWQDKNTNAVNVNAAKEREITNPIRKFATKNVFDMITDAVKGVKDKLKDWLGRKGDPADLAQEIAEGADGGGNDDKKRRKGKKGKAPKGKAGWASKAWGATKGLGKFALKGAGAVGTAYGAYSTYEALKEGRWGDAAMDGAMTAVGAGSTIGMITGAGALAGGLGATGMLAGLGGSALGLLGTAAGAALTAISSPVVLGALAVGAVGYGLYKGYKFFTRKKFNTTERMRMIEYGLPEKDDSGARKVYELEQYMESVSKTKEGSWELDDKKFKMKEVFDILDVDEKDNAQSNAMLGWFAKRFKPVYGKWKVMVKSISGEDKMDWLEKAGTKKLLEVFQQFKMSPDAYEFMTAPTKEIKLSSNRGTVEYYKKVWILDLKDTAVKDKDADTAQAASAAGTALITGAASNAAADQAGSKIPANAANASSLINSAGKESSTNSSKATVDYGTGFDSTYVTNSVSALDAIKWRAYGMKHMKYNTIQAFRTLEEECMKSLTVNSNYTVSFMGDMNKVLEKLGGAFGVTTSDTEKAKPWLIWFLKRFIPVFTKFHAGLAAVTKQTDVKSNTKYVDTIRPIEALAIARALIAVPGIWELKEYAFYYEDPNNSPASVEGNMKFLEDKAKDQTVEEETASKGFVGYKTPRGAKSKAADPVAEVQKEAAAQSSTSGMTPTAANQSGGSSTSKQLGVATGDDVEHASYANAASSGGKATTVSASTGPLVTAGGDLYSGAGAQAFLAGKKVDYNGLHPSIRRLFFGMVEEYGMKTGKKVNVNAAFRSSADQARLFKQLGPGKAARPGTSLHEFGLALDVNTDDLNEMEKLGLMRKYGFTRPLNSESWHIEPAGIFNNEVRQRAKTDHNFATNFIESSVGRGGGGLGAKGKGGRLARDDRYAKSLFDSTGGAIAANDEKLPTPSAPLTPSGASATGGAGAGSIATSQNDTPISQGIPDAESKGGIGSSGSGAGAGAGSVSSSISQGAAAANDSFKQSSNSAAMKGEGGKYSTLPESTGTGWAANSALITGAAKMVGVDPALAAAIAAKESSINPGAAGKNAVAGNNKAQGLYQFMPGTWSDMIKKHGAKYGIKPGTSPLDPKANAVLGMEYIKASMSSGDGSPAMAYLGHFLGPGGLKKFQAMRGDELPSLKLSAASSNNPNIFFEGGDKRKPRTKAAMISFIEQQLNKQLADFNIPLKLDAPGATAYAANDSSKESSSSTSSSASSTIETVAGGGSTTRFSDGRPDKVTTDASYTPPREKLSSIEAPKKSMAAQALQSFTSSNTPVPSGNSKTAANESKGIETLTDVSNQQLAEAKITNTILNQILTAVQSNTKLPSETKMTNASAKQETAPAPSTYKQAEDPPASFVQRRRAVA